MRLDRSLASSFAGDVPGRERREILGGREDLVLTPVGEERVLFPERRRLRERIEPKVATAVYALANVRPLRESDRLRILALRGHGERVAVHDVGVKDLHG